MRNDLSGRVGCGPSPRCPARVVLLDGCGHWVRIEARDRFLAGIGPSLHRIDDEHDRGAET